MKHWGLHLCSPFNWLYKLFSGIVGASEQNDVQLLSPWFIPTTVRPSLQHEEHLQDLFCTSSVLETVSPQLTIYFKATKNSVKNLCSVLHRLKSLYLLLIYTRALLRIRGCLEYLALHTLPVWSANEGTTEQSPAMLWVSLSRSPWPGCIQPCTGQVSNSKHPTLVFMPENQTSWGLPEAFANQYTLFSCCTLCPYSAFGKALRINMKNSLQLTDKAVEIQRHKCSNQYLFFH